MDDRLKFTGSMHVILKHKYDGSIDLSFFYYYCILEEVEGMNFRGSFQNRFRENQILKMYIGFNVGVRFC
jgi:hypothetical protein